MTLIPHTRRVSPDPGPRCAYRDEHNSTAEKTTAACSPPGWNPGCRQNRRRQPPSKPSQPPMRTLMTIPVNDPETKRIPRSDTPIFLAVEAVSL